MTHALASVVRRVCALAAQRRVRFTRKALHELASLGLDTQDAYQTLEALRSADFVRRLASAQTGEWLYVFKPNLFGLSIYVKLVLRDGCLVVSFHEDDHADEDGEEDV